jgi:undecaprenyl-phosphate galactose phosphotransferase
MRETPQYPIDGEVLSLPQSFQAEIRHFPVKRTCDVLFSAVALTLTLPITLPVSLAIWWSSPGPVFYAQERIGRGGRPFLCYKFRTMHADAEERLQEILKDNPVLQKEWQETRKLKNDPRISVVGQFLRKTSLDELPQFWNVLKGDMSVVGPRPVVADEVVVHFGPKAHKVLSIRPGITGVWQVTGRSDTSYERRVAMDEHYVDNRSLFYDLWIVAKTIPAMLFRRGAY